MLSGCKALSVNLTQRTDEGVALSRVARIRDGRVEGGDIYAPVTHTVLISNIMASVETLWSYDRI